jgi:hypothetical protein
VRIPSTAFKRQACTVVGNQSRCYCSLDCMGLHSSPGPFGAWPLQRVRCVVVVVLAAAFQSQNDPQQYSKHGRLMDAVPMGRICGTG